MNIERKLYTYENWREYNVTRAIQLIISNLMQSNVALKKYYLSESTIKHSSLDVKYFLVLI